MRWARFEQKGKKPSYGIVEGKSIRAVKGTPFGKWTKTDVKVPLKSVKLLVPVVPPTFYAFGLNYLEHVKHHAKKTGTALNLPPKPDVGYRAKLPGWMPWSKATTGERVLRSYTGPGRVLMCTTPYWRYQMSLQRQPQIMQMSDEDVVA